MNYLMVGGPLDGQVVKLAPDVQRMTGPWPGTYVRSALSPRFTVFQYTEPIPPHAWTKPKRVGGFPAAQ